MKRRTRRIPTSPGRVFRRVVALAGLAGVAMLTSAPQAAVSHPATQTIASRTARAPSKLWTAYVKVSVKGRQTVTWTMKHTANPADICDANGSGSGSQQTDFKTEHAGMYTLFQYGHGELSMVETLASLTGKTPHITVKGTLTRHGTETWGPSRAQNCECGCGGDTTPPPAPDCGTRRLGTYSLEPTYLSKTGFMSLDEDDEISSGGDFQNCPYLGPGTWELLPVINRLPGSELRHYGKIVLVGTKQRSGGNPDDGQWHATFRWTLTIARVASRGHKR